MGAQRKRLELWRVLAEAEDGRMVADACERWWQRRRRRHVVASGLLPLLLVALQLLTVAAEDGGSAARGHLRAPAELPGRRRSLKAGRGGHHGQGVGHHPPG
eukprot:SM003882S14566  [mRNA]  locus=s3882:1:791:- [translate_table: standard]